MSDQDANNGLGDLGLKFTKIYLILLFTVLPALAYLGAIDIKPVELNQIGDFLAGAFGPLAIFWLVLGFFQQGNELRNSVEALRLQTEELNQSVQQQKHWCQYLKNNTHSNWKNAVAKLQMKKRRRCQILSLLLRVEAAAEGRIPQGIDL